ncbi:MAG: DUF4118 domain-containing protein [Tepidisphaeraceae bacterium]
MSETPTDHRPDPDALLAEANEQEARQRRGKLKIFFGMSAGVGKTYAMLEEARKRAAEGVDVLVGYAEPHIRPETEAVLIGLDLLPYRMIEYRGAMLKELDLDAVLKRRPSLCCIDELAHTNAPGMRHAKRWQDVAEILEAGIHVYTTLNVQHLESVNDLVERITGVRVRETLPDAVFDAADDVELIDIAPGELLERFREGLVYRPEQAERASRHFFTTGNLIALRELALRKTADRVDEQMQAHRREGRLRKVIPSSEAVLVCVGPSPLSGRLVRSARRLASGLRAKLIAVSVERPGASARSADEQRRVEANLRLAEDLGAQTVTLSGLNIASEVLAYATAHNVTKIVVGKPVQSRWRDALFGSVVDDLIRQSGEIDIYVIRGESERDERSRAVFLRKPMRRDWIGYGHAILVVALTTLIGWPLYHRIGTANVNILMLYLLGVLWIATRRSRGAAIVASILGVATFDLVFVPPYYTFAISDRQYVVTFAVMFLTAMVISALTHRVRSQADAARQRERRTAALLGLSRDLAEARTIEQVASATSRHVGDVLGERSMLLIANADGQLDPPHVLPGAAQPAQPGAKELGVAQWAFEHDQASGRGTNTLPSAEATYVPLRGSNGPVGVLGIVPADDVAHWSGERRQLAEGFASQTALAVERASLVEETRLAWERVEAEFLRNTLLSAVSHDLRTPLAGITGSATTLLESGDRLSPEGRREMLETLVSESERMERLINNLLDMSRLEAGGLRLQKQWAPIEELIGSALRHVGHRLGGREVSTDVPHDLPLVLLDETAIEQVLVNLLDNALAYTPPHTPLQISARRVDQSIVLSVADRGPGLPGGAEKRVFEKFFRAQPVGEPSSGGVGLGLTICRGIVEAHGGQITAANRSGGGAVFEVTLPIGGTPPAVDAAV